MKTILSEFIPCFYSLQANQPKALYGQAVIKVDDCLYTIGGTSGHTYFSDVHKLDLTTLKWTNEFKFQGDLDMGIPSRCVEIAIASVFPILQEM